MTKESHTK